MSHENYVYRKNQLLKTFNKLLARVQPSVYSWLGEEQARQFMLEARQEYEELIPRIPFIIWANNLHLALSKVKARMHWKLKNPHDVESWGG